MRSGIAKLFSVLRLAAHRGIRKSRLFKDIFLWISGTFSFFEVWNYGTFSVLRLATHRGIWKSRLFLHMMRGLENFQEHCSTCYNTGQPLFVLYLRSGIPEHSDFIQRKLSRFSKFIGEGSETTLYDSLLPINLGDSYFPQFFGAVIQCEITVDVHHDSDS